MDVVGAALLSVDNVVELLEVKGGDLAWRHDFNCVLFEFVERNRWGVTQSGEKLRY
jgi:hypothetical protein